MDRVRREGLFFSFFFFFIAAVSNANPQFASEAPQRNAGVDEVVRLSDIYLWPRAKAVH